MCRLKKVDQDARNEHMLIMESGISVLVYVFGLYMLVCACKRENENHKPQGKHDPCETP